MKILIVDDEQAIADLIEVYLKNEGYQTVKCFNGKDALNKVQKNEFDLAILDLMLPDVDGFSICSAIRERGYKYPVIMLTARTQDIDKITGLTLGADDYVTKPFNPLELTARVKAHLRRYKQYNTEAESKDRIEIRGLEINNESHKCFLFNEEIPLTPTEFGILRLLCENAGRVVSTEDIFEKVWGEKYLDSNNTVMVHIRRIREKLHEPSRNPRFVKTVWGVGYKIEK